MAGPELYVTTEFHCTKKQTEINKSCIFINEKLEIKFEWVKLRMFFSLIATIRTKLITKTAMNLNFEE
jgi:hypothetical protein